MSQANLMEFNKDLLEKVRKMAHDKEDMPSRVAEMVADELDVKLRHIHSNGPKKLVIAVRKKSAEGGVINYADALLMAEMLAQLVVEVPVADADRAFEVENNVCKRCGEIAQRVVS